MNRLARLLVPYWESETVFEESILPIEKQGAFERKKLMYPAESILEIRKADDGTLFRQGRDYLLEKGELVFPASTCLPRLAYDEMYLDEPNGLRVSSIREKGKFLRTESGEFFNNYYALVTYRTKKEYLFPAPDRCDSACEQIRAQLKRREPLRFVFYGDSITTGVNASGYFDLPPHTPIFSKMAVQRLREIYGYSRIAHINTAVGGWNSVQGLAHLEENVLRREPDLLFLGFGMNDGGGYPRNTFGEEFYARMDEMTKTVRNRFPDCCILLASPMLPNADAYNSDDHYPVLSNQPQCAAALKRIAHGCPNTAFLDVSGYSSRIAARKQFYDMGDTMVHPNDFLARLYAQMIVHVLTDKEEK